MAARYAVGGSFTWDATDTTHWASSTGGAGGQSVPGASDTVIFDANSGGGTITLAYSPTIISITGGNHTGTFDAAGYDITMTSCSYTGTGARTVIQGNGQWTITGNNASVWNWTTVTNMTFTKGTNPVDFTYSGSTGTRSIVCGSFASAGGLSAHPDFNITAGSDIVTINNSRVGHLNFTGFSGTLNNGTRVVYGNILLSSTMSLQAGTAVTTFGTTSGTQTITSSGKTLDFPIIFNGVGGTFQLLDDTTIGSTRSTTLTNGTFDINGKAFSTGLFLSNNSNTRALVDIATGGSFTITGSNATIWNTTTSTGLTSTTFPTIVSNYASSTGTRTFIGGTTEASSFNLNITGGTDIVTLSGGWNGVDFTGFSGTLNNSARTLYGNWVISAGMTLSGGTSATTFSPSIGPYTLPTNAITFDFPISISGATALVQLGANLTLGNTRQFQVAFGSDFSCVNGVNNYAISCGTLSIGGTINFGTATHLANGTGTVINIIAASTIVDTNYTLRVTDTSNTSVTILPRGKNINKIWLDRGASTGNIVFNTPDGTVIGTLLDTGTAAHTYVYQSGCVFTYGTFTVGGTAGNLVSLTSSVTGKQYYIVKNGTPINTDYLYIRDCSTLNAFAGTNSVDGGNNVGWEFTTPSTISGTVRLSGAGVNGAIVRCIRQLDNTEISNTTTAVDGTYSFPYTSASKLYHVCTEYTNGGNKYNAPSLWNILPI